MFCITCPVGTYSDIRGNGPCKLCQNKPEMAIYVGTGSTTSQCAFACKQGFNSKGCLSQFEAVLQDLGGPVGLGACILSILLLTAGASLAVYWRRKRAVTVYQKQAEAQPLMSDLPTPQCVDLCVLCACIYGPCSRGFAAGTMGPCQMWPLMRGCKSPTCRPTRTESSSLAATPRHDPGFWRCDHAGCAGSCVATPHVSWCFVQPTPPERLLPFVNPAEYV